MRPDTVSLLTLWRTQFTLNLFNHFNIFNLFNLFNLFQVRVRGMTRLCSRGGAGGLGIKGWTLRPCLASALNSR